MKKNLHIIWCTIILLSAFLIFGCREEQESVQNSRQQVSSAKIGYKKLSEIPEILPSIEKAKNQMQSNSNILTKGVEDLDLDTENILVMDFADNGKTVSMIVNQPDIDIQIQQNHYSVINLIIVRHDGIESYFLAKYIPYDGKPFYSYSDFVGTVEFLDLNGNVLQSHSTTNKKWAFEFGCYAYVINDNAGFWQIENSEWICAGSPGNGPGGGTTSGPGGGTTSGPGNNGGGAGGNDDSGDPPPAVPNIPTENILDQKKYTAFLNYLEPQQYQFLANQPEYSNNVFFYLKANNFTSDSKRLMSLSISLFIEGVTWDELKKWFTDGNSLSFDNTNPSNSIVFNSIKDLKIALISKNTNMSIEGSIISENGNEKIVTAKIKRTGIWNSGEEVRIKLIKINNLWTFDSVTSSEYGLTMGTWSFTQIDFIKNLTGNILTVDVTGYENYNIFAEGIGTIYKDKVKIRVKINNITGNITNIEFIDL